MKYREAPRTYFEAIVRLNSDESCIKHLKEEGYYLFEATNRLKDLKQEAKFKYYEDTFIIAITDINGDIVVVDIRSFKKQYNDIKQMSNIDDVVDVLDFLMEPTDDTIPIIAYVVYDVVDKCEYATS